MSENDTCTGPGRHRRKGRGTPSQTTSRLSSRLAAGPREHTVQPGRADRPRSPASDPAIHPSLTHIRGLLQGHQPSPRWGKREGERERVEYAKRWGPVLSVSLRIELRMRLFSAMFYSANLAPASTYRCLFPSQGNATPTLVCLLSLSAGPGTKVFLFIAKLYWLHLI